MPRNERNDSDLPPGFSEFDFDEPGRSKLDRLENPARGYVNDDLGNRMKNYEKACRSMLPWRMPVVIRVDGKAFHTFTKGMQRPFDARLMAAMDTCAAAICEEAQGACLAYVQSDEISVLLHNYKRLKSMPWFENQVQKMVSVSASVATAVMQREMAEASTRTALFDARVFVLPEAEVTNYFIWRQQDATRNSIQMVARSLYSDRQCYRKSCPQLQEMIHAKGQNWNDLSTGQKRGRCVTRETYEREGAIRHMWATDYDIPIFTQDRSYIERHLAVDSEKAA